MSGGEMTGITDSPRGWVNEHIRRYVTTGGADGHEWKPGVPTLLLTTTGNKTGLRRRTALIYARDGDTHLVVASNGGSAGHPAWYRNLDADPHVHVQVGAEEFDATARTAVGAERERLWPLVAKVWLADDDYQAKTEREIPVVVLTAVR
jgi:deazaflavin-dependent oxidoreductase (nitroreductase family)